MVLLAELVIVTERFTPNPFAHSVEIFFIKKKASFQMPFSKLLSLQNT